METFEKLEATDLYEVHAIEKYKLPEKWRIYRREALPHSRSGDCIYMSLTGAVCEHKYTKGKRKGRTNWGRLTPQTKATVNITTAEHDAWKIEWEKKTGKCSKCTGTGEVFQSWNVETGVKSKQCQKCNGTGKIGGTEIE